MKIGLGVGLPFYINRLGGSSFDADYQALLDASSGDAPTEATAAHQNTMVLDIKAAGVWGKLDLFYGFATDGGDDIRRRNWIAPATFQVTLVGTPTFTSLEGYLNNGAGWIESNWSPANDGVNYQTNDASIGSYDLETPIGTSFGTRDATNTNDIIVRWDGNSVGINGAPDTGAASAQAGFNVLDRSAATEFKVFKNGVLDDTLVNNSQSAPTQTMGILTRKTGATSQNIGSNHKVAIVFAGASLASEASDFFTAVEKYMDAIGKGVVA